MDEARLYHTDWNPVSTFSNTTSWADTLASGSVTVVVALIGVPMTESRMGRSRGRFSVVRLLAPVGVFGFLAVLKVHLASIVSEKIAKELNLAVSDMASASRLGSIRRMNVKGVKFDAKVDIVETKQENDKNETVFVRREQDFKMESDADVSHVSTRQRMEVLRHSQIIRNNRERLITYLLITLGQAILLFGFTIAAEYAASRTHSLGLIYSATVVAAEITTGITEWLWTSKVSRGSVLIGLHDEDHDDVQRDDRGRPLTSTVKLIRIFEQKIRDQLYEDQINLPAKAGSSIIIEPFQHSLRHYQINRKVQITMASMQGDPRKQWLISDRTQKEGKRISKAASRFYFYFYNSVLLCSTICLLAEVLSYVLYIASSFGNQGQDSIKYFGQWFGVQLLVFLVKGFSPLLDRYVRAFREPTDQKGYSEYGKIYTGENSAISGQSALRGHVRAIKEYAVLIQSIEHRLPHPCAVGSFVRCNSGRDKDTAECVVPQVLIVNGTNVLSRLKIVEPGVSKIKYDAENEMIVCLFEFDRAISQNNGDGNGTNYARDKENRKAARVHILRIKIKELSDQLCFRIIQSEHRYEGWGKRKELDFVFWDSQLTQSFPRTVSSIAGNGPTSVSNPPNPLSNILQFSGLRMIGAANEANSRATRITEARRTSETSRSGTTSASDASQETASTDSSIRRNTRQSVRLDRILSAQSLYFSFAHVNDFKWPKLIVTCHPSLLEVNLPRDLDNHCFRPGYMRNITSFKDASHFQTYQLENTYIHPHHELSDSAAWLSAASRLVETGATNNRDRTNGL
ncbi:hypothetical protein CBS101457_005029 [Exobasidium rhododendri]|nr:hypothetical protein CBS101457_005029 [Exobasidium rhododendri]